MTVFKREQLQEKEPLWASAVLAPCLFFGVVHRGDGIGLQEAKIGHFPASFMEYEIGQHLSGPNFSAEHTRLMVAGLSQRANHQTLMATAQRLQNKIKDAGIPMELRWERDDRPLLIDPRNGHLVSDLGLGLSSDSELFVSRLVAFGVTLDHAVMVSITTCNTRNSSFTPVQTMVLTDGSGALTEKHLTNPH